MHGVMRAYLAGTRINLNGLRDLCEQLGASESKVGV